MLQNDKFFMQMALLQAQQAAQLGEIPVGAVIVSPQLQVLAQSHNLCEQTFDPTAHAEILSIGAATHALGTKILNSCTLYVTLEPCPMCAAALYWAQIGRIVFAAPDHKRGYSCFSPSLLHPRTQIQQSDEEQANQARQLLQDFFQRRR